MEKSEVAKPREIVAEAHKPSSGNFFPTLDGLRGLAVLSVVMLHTVYFNPTHTVERALNAIVKGGGMGVQVFFVLSGFLISHTLFNPGIGSKPSPMRRVGWPRSFHPFICPLSSSVLRSGGGKA